MQSARRALVVMVTYGRPDLVEQSLRALTGHPDVLVVDNSRSPEIEAVCRRRGARYRATTRNVGYAAGVNLGLAQASGRDVLLVNPDATLTVADVDTLQALVHAGPRRAAVAPRLVRPDGRVEPTWWPLPRPWTTWAGAVGLADLVGRRRRFLNGAVLMLNGAAVAELGGFDERFFLYSEEADWQARALAAGWTLAACPAVTATHLGGASTADSALRSSLFHGSAELFARKWYGAWGWRLFRAGSVVAAIRRAWTSRGRQARREQLEVVSLYLRGPARAMATAIRELP